jgi:hypothetical protein
MIYLGSIMFFRRKKYRLVSRLSKNPKTIILGLVTGWYRNFLFGRRLTRLRRINADSQDFKYKELAVKPEVKCKAFDNLRK